MEGSPEIIQTHSDSRKVCTCCFLVVVFPWIFVCLFVVVSVFLPNVKTPYLFCVMGGEHIVATNAEEMLLLAAVVSVK